MENLEVITKMRSIPNNEFAALRAEQLAAAARSGDVAAAVALLQSQEAAKVAAEQLVAAMQTQEEEALEAERDPGGGGEEGGGGGGAAAAHGVALPRLPTAARGQARSQDVLTRNDPTGPHARHSCLPLHFALIAVCMSPVASNSRRLSASHRA